MPSFCEYPQFYATSEPVARKEYGCVECKAPILPGEKHLKVTGKWDDLETHRQHLACAEACEAVRDAGLSEWSECLYFGELHEWAKEAMRGPWLRAQKKAPQWAKVRRLYAAVLRREKPHCVGRKKR